MCIIVIKPYDVDMPPQGEIEECFRFNHDGFGMAIAEKDVPHVLIRKGALTIGTTLNMLSAIEKPKSKQIVMHFRTATEGAICQGNCHPFPVSSKIEYLQASHIKADVAVAHNGVLDVTNTEELTPNNNLPAGSTLTYEKGVQGYRDRLGKFHPCKWSMEDWAAHYNCQGGFWSTYYRVGMKLKFSDTLVFVRDYLAPMRREVLNPAFLNLISNFVPGKFALLTTKTFWTIGAFKEDKGRLYSNESYKVTTVVQHNYVKETKTEKHKSYKAKEKLGGLGTHVNCDFCKDYVLKQETHDHEDMILCEKCFKQLEPDANSKSNVPSTNVADDMNCYSGF